MRHISNTYTWMTLFLSAVLLAGCGKEETGHPYEPEITLNEKELIVSTRPADISDNNYEVMNYLHLYGFDRDSLYQEKTKVESRSKDQLTATLLPKVWNLVAISCMDRDVAKALHLPVTGGDMEQLMWQMKDTPAGYMEEMPELLYGVIPDLEVARPSTRAEVELIRNVARVDVILEYEGFDPDYFEAYPELCYFELNRLPTSLSWEGKLLPERDKPYVSDKPTKKMISFDAKAKADTVRFIVPAHRGEDFDAPLADIEDYSRHTLFIQACLPNPEEEGVGYLAEKSNPEGVEIPVPLKVNRILEVKFRFFGPGAVGLLDVKVTAKDWKITDIIEEFN